MLNRPIRCRRVRRTDADAVFALLAASGGPIPPRDRSSRHRFRLLVADLGGDCYVAVADETVVGLVHVTYARHLIDRQRATIEVLLAAAPRREDTAAALAALVRERAGRRGCRVIDWREPVRDDAMQAFTALLGARPADPRPRVEMPDPAE